MLVRLFGDTRYFTKAQLEETSPSRREGVSAQDEARWRATTSKQVKAALKRLKLPDWVYQTSMHYINRFYLSRSISKNDRHLVVGGAVLLASKVQESPRSVQDVAYVLLQMKNANKQQQSAAPDQASLEQFKEGVTLVEQCILFAINFNLNLGVETHATLAKRLLESEQLWAGSTAVPATPEEAEEHDVKLKLFQFLLTFLNDSVQTSLCLQFPPNKLAVAALGMAAKRFASTRYGPSSGRQMPPILERVVSLASDAEWLASKELTLQEATDIESQLNELYGSVPSPAPQQQAQLAPAQQQAPQSAPAEPVAAQQPQQQAAESPEEGEVVPAAAGACGQDHERRVAQQGTSSAPPVREHPCGSSGVACGGSILEAPAAADHPSVPRPCVGASHPHAGHVRRVSDVEDGEEQVTSELHPVPEGRDLEAEVGTPLEEPAGCGPTASANGNCSPNGLTNGNASGSGCGHAEGQPEVSSDQQRASMCGKRKLEDDGEAVRLAADVACSKVARMQCVTEPMAVA